MGAITLPTGTRRILIVRTDAIGDNVLGAGMLEALRRAVPGTEIVYACQDRVAELWGRCPHVAKVIAFNRGRAYAEEGYREEVIGALRAVEAEVVLNPVYSREPLTDLLAVGAGGGIRVAWDHAQRGFEDQKARHNTGYTHLLEPGEAWQPELQRHEAFLGHLGVTAGKPLGPEVWLGGEDEAFADGFFAEHGLEPARTAILFAAAGSDARVNPHLGQAVAAALEGDWTVVAVGVAGEFAVNQRVLDELPQRTINACGLSTLRQTAALLRRAGLAIGTETSNALLACAVGTRNVVVLGGGHFRRFMPYSPLTTAACLPLSCFRCDWQCRYERAYCVRDVAWQTIAEAIRVAHGPVTGRPRLVVQRDWAAPAGGPALEPAVCQDRALVCVNVPAVDQPSSLQSVPRPSSAAVDGPRLEFLADPRDPVCNRAVHASRAGYMALASADRAGVARLAAALDQNPSAALAILTDQPDFERTALFQLNTPEPLVVWRRRLHHEVGPFDATSAAPLYEFCLRVLGAGHSFRSVVGAVPPVGGLSTELAWELQSIRERYWQRAWGGPPWSPAVRLQVGLAAMSARLQAQASRARVAIYGAGRHTQRHLAAFRAAIEPRGQLVAILDDAPRADVVDGVPIRATTSWRELALNLIVVSSDTYEDAMTARLRQVIGSAMPIATLYDPSLTLPPPPP